MSDRPIIITAYDLDRLVKLLAEARYSEYRGSAYLTSLEDELSKAQVVDPKEIPPDVITMNSQVLLEDTTSGEEMVYTLVFPEESDIVHDKISILAPIGTAMLGYRVGDVFEWKVPDGVQTLRVKKILYQPEAGGNYEL